MLQDDNQSNGFYRFQSSTDWLKIIILLLNTRACKGLVTQTHRTLKFSFRVVVWVICINNTYATQKVYSLCVLELQKPLPVTTLIRGSLPWVLSKHKVFWLISNIWVVQHLVSESAIHSAPIISFGIHLAWQVSESPSLGFLLSCLAVWGT